jgi:hypothetical protein
VDQGFSLPDEFQVSGGIFDKIGHRSSFFFMENLCKCLSLAGKPGGWEAAGFQRPRLAPFGFAAEPASCTRSLCLLLPSIPASRHPAGGGRSSFFLIPNLMPGMPHAEGKKTRRPPLGEAAAGEMNSFFSLRWHYPDQVQRV